MDSLSSYIIVLYTAYTHLSNICIRMDENKISFGKHILDIYQVYSWHVNWKGIYLAYSCHIPGKYYLGIPDVCTVTLT